MSKWDLSSHMKWWHLYSNNVLQKIHEDIIHNKMCWYCHLTPYFFIKAHFFLFFFNSALNHLWKNAFSFQYNSVIILWKILFYHYFLNEKFIKIFYTLSKFTLWTAAYFTKFQNIKNCSTVLKSGFPIRFPLLQLFIFI